MISGSLGFEVHSSLSTLSTKVLDHLSNLLAYVALHSSMKTFPLASDCVTADLVMHAY